MAAGRLEQRSEHDRVVAAVRDAAAESTKLDPVLKQITEQLVQQQARQEKFIAEMRDVAAAEPARLEAFAGQITRQLADQDTRHNQMIATVRDAAAGDTSKLEPVLKQIAQQLGEQQSRHEQLVSMVRQNAASQNSMPRAAIEQIAAKLVEHDAQYKSLINSARASQAIGATQPVAALPAGAESLLAKITDQFSEQQARHEQLVGVVRDAVASVQSVAVPNAQETSALLGRIASQIDAGHAAQQAAAAGAERHAKAIEDLAAKLAAQPQHHDQLVAIVRETIQSHTSRSEPALQQIVEMRRTFDGDRAETRPLLERMADQLAAMESRQSMVIEAVRISSPVPSTSSSSSDMLLQQVSSQLEAQREQLDTLVAASRDRGRERKSVIDEPQLPAPLKFVRPDSQERGNPLLAEITSHMDNPDLWSNGPKATIWSAVRRPSAFVGAAMAAMVLLSGASLWMIATLKSENAAMADSVESANLKFAKLDEKLNAISTGIKTQREDVEPLLKDIAAIRNEHASDRWFSFLLPEGVDEMSREAFAARPGPVLQAPMPEVPAASAGPAGTVLGQLNSPSSMQVMTKPTGQIKPLALTPLQTIFKASFESGLPMQYGGRIDPDTKQLVGGRLLVPSVARKLGITKWEEWYKWDDFHEKLRLDQQAENFKRERRIDPSKHVSFGPLKGESHDTINPAAPMAEED